MNTFKLRSLIRSTASRISSSIPKPRFFSNGTDGESALYHHARVFRKPLSTGFKLNLSNSVSLMGFVDRPVRVIDTEPDRFGVSTLLKVKDPRDPNRCFRIPLTIWDVMARKCITHLKPNDFIFVSGRLVSYDKSSGFEDSGLSLDYQVKVSEVNYVMAPPSHVLDSQIPQNPKPDAVSLKVAREDGIEEPKNSKICLWQAFFANPHEWWDKRRSKKNPRQPDFKHKDTGEALWLDSDVPAWVSRQLEIFDRREADGLEDESKNGDIDLWQAFFASPDDWWDKRRNKKNPRLPDFKHKDTDEYLWLSSDTPVWVTKRLELYDQRKGDDIEESEIYLWKAFFANPDEWWDKRRNKKNSRLPDFKHKETGEALWVNSDTPVWITRQLEMFDESKPDGIEESNNDKIYLWQVFFANPHEWWDNRRNKKNPREPDFTHKDTREALWLDSDIPVWVTRQLELFDQRNENNSCYGQEQTGCGRLGDWV